jgi:hypothetical protein
LSLQTETVPYDGVRMKKTFSADRYFKIARLRVRPQNVRRMSACSLALKSRYPPLFSNIVKNAA